MGRNGYKQILNFTKMKFIYIIVYFVEKLRQTTQIPTNVKYHIFTFNATNPEFEPVKVRVS